MRNLILTSVTSNKLELEKILHCCLADDKLYLLSESLELFAESELLCSLVDVILGQSKNTSVPVDLNFCNFTENIVIAFTDGDLVEVNVSDIVAKYTGCIEPGIAAASWSPGEDLYAVVSTSANLLIFTSDINEPLVETDLTGEGEEKIVAVGWGKKETQFRGKEGKLSATQSTAVSSTLLKDDGKVRISWRGDGECLAVSMLTDGHRFITVVNKSGSLLHRSEMVPGLESALCWRPSGNLITSSERLPNKHNICFFEKNTLPHGGFTLSGDWAVRELLWSTDSHVLAAVLVGDSTVIKLFTTSNYHWYCKLSIPIADDEKLVYIGWDKSVIGLLHVVTSNQQSVSHLRYAVRFAVNRSVSRIGQDEALVCVIDGSRLLVSNFRSAIIPPPMSSYTIDFPQQINGVSFLPNSNDFAVLLVDKTVTFFKYNGDTKRHVIAEHRRLQDAFQIHWVMSDLLLGLNEGDRGLNVLKLSDNNLNEIVDVNCAVRGVSVITGSKVLVWTDNEFLEIDLNTLEIAPSSFPQLKKCGKLINVEVHEDTLARKVTIFALDSAHRLYVDSAEKYNNITSIRLDDDVLLMTTLQHKLLCWPVTPLDNSRCVPERAIERGARIVTTVPGTGKVVLQLPRGNLEVIKPRLLSVKIITRHLSALNYADAYGLMRRERINLNLLHDHDPDAFINNVSLLIHSINDQHYLCNFIAELAGENVTKTTYAEYCNATADVPEKVNRVCSAILEAISKSKTPGSFYLLQLFCLVKTGDLKGALQTIQGDKDQSYARKLEGLTHLLYIVDIDKLFKEALGTYDFNLVMFIAENSNKDPKEYLPFLEQLKSLDENYRKFTIDRFLKRFELALGHLGNCPDRTVEIVEFTVAHSLYDAALRLVPEDSAVFEQICIKYGEELTRQKQHTDAGNIYRKAGQYNLALFSYTRSGEWRKVIACAQQLKFSDSEMSELISSLVDNMTTDKRFEDAGRLLIEFGNDVPGGVAALCSAHMFKDACQIARSKGLSPLLENVIKPAALNAHSMHIADINRRVDTIKQHADRLKLVREHRQQQEDNGELDWDDSASDSSYGSSRGSSRGSKTSAVSRSAKNARKLERKLLSLKEGGPFEDVALIATLFDTISELVLFKGLVYSLNEVLVDLKESANAVELQNVLRSSLATVAHYIPKIWPSDDSGMKSNSIAVAFAERVDTLPAVVRAVQPKIIAPPDLKVDVIWEIPSLSEGDSTS